jgi:hypothetical protein
MFPALLSPVSPTLYPFFVMSHGQNAGQNKKKKLLNQLKVQQSANTWEQC